MQPMSITATKTPGARNTDPETSHKGSADAAVRSGSQRYQLLEAFVAHPAGLTSWEAAKHAKLMKRSCCYWKRVSELHADGFLTTIHHSKTGEPLTRPNPDTGSAQQVLKVTTEGRVALRMAKKTAR